MPGTQRNQIPSGFAKSVFVNCPFDDKYLPLFRAAIFSVHDMSFRARCSLEASNAGQVRFDKIQGIIAECKYSIHDISTRTHFDQSCLYPLLCVRKCGDKLPLIRQPSLCAPHALRRQIKLNNR